VYTEWRNLNLVNYTSVYVVNLLRTGVNYLEKFLPVEFSVMIKMLFLLPDTSNIWLLSTWNVVSDVEEYSERETGHQSFREASLLSRSAATQPIHIPENKGGFPYILWRAGYRNGGHSLFHTWSHAISFIGHFNLWGDPSLVSPRCYMTFLKFFFCCLFHYCTHFLLPAFLPQCDREAELFNFISLKFK
jgi:hypothetical protein